MSTILNGKKISSEILQELKIKTANLPEKPGLTVVIVGDDPASKVYVASKEKKAKELGFKSTVIRLDEKTQKKELEETIEKLNNDPKVHGILLQLPLPKHLDANYFIEKIHPKKDVDGFHPINMGKLVTKTSPYAVACTPSGVIELLKRYDIKPQGKEVVIVGRSNIVGKPLAQLFINLDATVTVAHSKTRDLAEVTRRADILVAAVGVKHIITKDMVKKGATVVDVGIIRDENGKLSGDVDFENVKEVAQYITPVPGGVGPMTIAMLMQNTFELFQKS
ncbi:methylenetetrahydrofolate dehydrogenase (NADP+) / methenyltetrahydrofolate cyclohydrolase [Candidatus Gastranaerophilus sp. (ex Termes propinquus)]|nr:methylenetetrahydrofolate dehydrogenase (NADP+) / methenyltetrahydrofolate cyclohydrolase [Candidatus Gastranaerophilus sp. (ex Termes propinquus)]